MSRDEIIKVLQTQPHVKITHVLFDADEYLYSKEDENVYDENGYLFESWEGYAHNGMRMRQGGNWETGWSIKN